MIRPPTYDMVRSLKKGDISSFDKLYRLYYRKIYLFARGIIKSHEDAERVVQDVFIKVWEKRETLDEFKSFESFIFTISYNNTISLLRKNLSKKRFLDEFQKKLEDEKQFIDETEYRDLEQKAKTLIDQLPPRRKQVYQLSRDEGLTYAEISGKLSISVNTVENHMVSALKFLRKNLGQTLHSLFFFLLFI